MKNSKLIHVSVEELERSDVLDLYGDDPDRRNIVKKIKESEIVFGRMCELINALNRAKISYEVHPHPLVGGLWITYPAGNNPVYSIIAKGVMDDMLDIDKRSVIEFCDLTDTEKTKVFEITPEDALRRIKRHRDSFYADKRRTEKLTTTKK